MPNYPAASQRSKPITNPHDPPKDSPPPFPKYKVEDYPDGGLIVSCYVDPVIAKRLKLRAGPMDLGKYIYENILYRAYCDHVL